MPIAPTRYVPGSPVSTLLQRAPSDSELISSCLRNDEDAWALLVDRYKRLIYSIPVKQGLSREDAADVFQAVCADLVAELPRLRAHAALPKWLITTTARRCAHHRRALQRQPVASGDVEPDDLAAAVLPDAEFTAREREQALRAAIEELPPRCRALVEMLFFAVPPVPYRDAAARLGLATGSIGFIRNRCLTRLQAAITRAGL